MAQIGVDSMSVLSSIHIARRRHPVKNDAVPCKGPPSEGSGLGSAPSLDFL